MLESVKAHLTASRYFGNRLNGRSEEDRHPVRLMHGDDDQIVPTVHRPLSAKLLKTQR